MTRLGDVLRFIRVEHSVFALPFVYIGLLLAPGSLHFGLFLWTTLAAVGARGTAMSLNRIIDARIDAANPRTAGREMPRGAIGTGAAAALTAAFLALYLSSTHLLNPLVFRLSPLPLLAFVVYPYLKRFTSLCHLFLGFTLGFAPMGGWLAKTGAWVGVEVPLLLAFGVMFWVAGFDIVYALLDVRFDRANGIHSVPADLGVGVARALAALFHVATIGFFWAAALLADLWWLIIVGIGLVAALFAYQHVTLRPDDPASINRVAFTVNGYTGFVLLGAVIAELYVLGGL